MISVRIAKRSDLEVIQELHAKLFEYEDSLITLYNLQYDKSEYSKKYFLNRLDPSNGCIFLAVDNSKIIGYLCAGKGSEEYRAVTKYAEIESLFVLSEYRNQGIGKMLMDGFKEWAKNLGISRLKVEVVSINSRSLEYYKREGFVPTYLELEAILRSNN